MWCLFVDPDDIRIFPVIDDLRKDIHDKEKRDIYQENALHSGFFYKVMK
jgi:hypothetical protein